MNVIARQESGTSVGPVHGRGAARGSGLAPGCDTAEPREFRAPGSEHGAFRARTKEEVGQFLKGQGLKLVEPGIVSIVDWLPNQEPKPATSAKATAACGAMARVCEPTGASR
jgi:hypothetical protein